MQTYLFKRINRELYESNSLQYFNKVCSFPLHSTSQRQREASIKTQGQKHQETKTIKNTGEANNEVLSILNQNCESEGRNR